ncbi:hypothetical protein ID866_7858 [Astraeus odoratus]|nr:hypothetical protein ID866_7858 [Astraeus odoratus]
MLTDSAVQSGKDIQQYYGKWPFWRFLGMQEPASVLFSLWNMWYHVQGARQIRRSVPVTHPMRSYYLMWAYRYGAQVFVTHRSHNAVYLDLPRTEKLDYFSAALAIMYALYLTVTRMLHMYPRVSNWNTPKSTTYSRSTMYYAWSSLCIMVYIAHITYLSILPRFDYAYNMAFNLALGLSHNMLWLLYSLPWPTSFLKRFPCAPKTYRPPYAYKAGVFVALTTAATALELFDFPPVCRVLDAHALWHLSTAPIAKFWYNFLVEDAQDEGWVASRQ